MLCFFSVNCLTKHFFLPLNPPESDRRKKKIEKWQSRSHNVMVSTLDFETIAKSYVTHAIISAVVSFYRTKPKSLFVCLFFSCFL